MGGPPRRVAGDAGLGVLAGLLLAAVHPPGDLRWLAWIAPAPLVLACHGRRWFTRLPLGALCGLVYFGLTFRWILVHEARLLWGALAVGASFVALFAAATAWIESRPPGRATPLLYPACWLALVALYELQPMGSYWGHIAGDGDPLLRQLAALGGAAAMTFVVLCVACHLARCRAERSWLPGTGWVVALAAATLLHGGWRLARPPAPGPELVVGMIQPNFPEQRDYPAIFRRYRQMTLEALRRGAQVVVWPQYSLDEVDLRRDPRMQGIFAEARRIGRPLRLVLGTYEWRKHAGRDEFINLGQVYDSAGRLVGEHAAVSKPPGRGWSALGDGPPRAIDAGDGPWGLLVCYEDTTPHVARTLVRHESRLLFSLMNDGLFVGTGQPGQHLEVAVLRAVESGRWLVRNSNSGYGAIIDPRGRIVARSGVDRRALLVGRVRLAGGRTPFSITGDWIPPAMALLVLLALFARRLTIRPRPV